MLFCCHWGYGVYSHGQLPQRPPLRYAVTPARACAGGPTAARETTLQCSGCSQFVDLAVTRSRDRPGKTTSSTRARARQSVVTWKFMQLQNHDELCGRMILSPALFSYRWPLNALCSGTHRATGVALVIGFGGIMYGYVIRWCVGFPMLYHMLAGLRHLVCFPTPPYWKVSK
ncbi:hypothetical protein Pelo_8667 [Pelomyxa schiedti]|nr:hypothetical protein Pelo_8667 [Pelomyxa schiedti]